MRLATRTIAPVLTSLLLALGGIAFIAAPAQANIGTEHGGGFWYTDTDNFTVAVVAYDGPGPSPSIPSHVSLSDGNEYTVTAIWTNAFKNKGLTGVTIPATVTAIQTKAFAGNPALETVRFLGDAPTTITDAGVGESFDTTNASMRVRYPSPGSTGFASPTWHGYKTVPQVGVASLSALTSATFRCNGEVAIQLTSDLIGDHTARFDAGESPETGCNVELDLNGYDLTLRHIRIGTGSTLTVDDTSVGTPGTVTAATTEHEAAIQHATGATLVIDGGEVHASSQYGAGIGGGDGNNGGTTTINGGTVSATSNAGAGIGGGDNGNGGTITINGGTVTASSVLGAGIGGGSAGNGGTVVIGNGADVTASGKTAVGAGDAATILGSLSVAGTLRIPVGTSLVIPTGVTVDVVATGVITGPTSDNGGEIQGGGTIDNGGSIALPTAKVIGASNPVIVKSHHYNVAFDGQGGSDPDNVKVFAKSFTDGARTLPTPTRTGYTFAGWFTAASGVITQIEAATTLPGTSDGTPVAIPLYAKWSLSAPTLTGDPTTTGQVGSSFTYTPTLAPSTGTTVTLTSGSLPNGLSLDTTTGAITGTPSAGSGGTHAITLTADNDVNPNATLDVVITINEAPSITGASTATGEVGQPFHYTPTTLSGFPAPTVTQTDSEMPEGLSLDASTGKISGTPTAPGTFPITLQASNGIGAAPTLDLTITIATEPIAGLAPTITGTVREGQTLTANHGTVTPATATFVHQWKRDGANIAGAIAHTYLLKKADAGHRISVTITATAPEQSDQTATSSETTLVSSPYARIVVSLKKVKKGQPFTVTATGLKANQRYAIWLGGTKAYTGNADANGTVTRTAKFKYSINYGTRRVRVSGYKNSGKRTYTIYTTVKYVK